jgi:hypothetical protein
MIHPIMMRAITMEWWVAIRLKYSAAMINRSNRSEKREKEGRTTVCITVKKNVRTIKNTVFMDRSSLNKP